MARTGRPSGYSEELAERICDAIAVTAKGLEAICAEHEGFPTPEMIRRWLHKRDDFRGMFVRAKASQVAIYADQTLTLADNATPDEIDKVRLQIDTRKWYASKLAPRVFGDRTIVAGDAENPIATVIDAGELIGRIVGYRGTADPVSGE